MSKEISTTTTPVQSLFQSETVQNKFKELLGKKAASFCTTVVQLSTQNEMLSKCDPNSIMQSAMIAATLDLPINPNLGFAYILPYGAKGAISNRLQRIHTACTQKRTIPKHISNGRI
jgi:phage RecT family recombinase